MKFCCHLVIRRSILIIVCLLSVCGSGWAGETEKLNVEITGIKNDLLQNVEVFLSMYQLFKKQKEGLLDILKVDEKEAKPDLSERGIRRLHHAAPKEIRLGLQPFGYYDVQVDAKLKKVKGVWQAVYRIDPGPAVELRHVEVQVNGDGRDEPVVKEVLNSIELAPGQRLEHRKYEQAKSRLADALYKTGYIDARFTRSEIKVYPLKHRADILLTVESGPLYKYGPITVEQDILRPEFVNRFANIKQGDRFDTSKLVDFQLALINSNYFKHVEIITERERAVGSQIPVTVKAEPNKPQRYKAGLGFGTDTGPRANAGVELRRINRRGHKMHFDLRASQIQQQVGAQYLIPVKNIATDDFAFMVAASREKVGDIDTVQYKLGPSLNENWLGFRRRLSLSLENENFDVGHGTQTSTLLIPGFQLSRKYADDPLLLRSGYSAVFDIHGGLKSPLTDTTFLQTSISAHSVLPLTPRGRLLFRAELGGVRATSFSDLPPSQRFFAGGDQSVRGYPYQGLGPTNKEGDVIGGSYLAVASLEMDYLVYGNIGIAAFFDAGNAGDDFLPAMKKGVGMGLRYRSPVGMIRLDLAHPLDDPDNQYRVHISIGADL